MRHREALGSDPARGDRVSRSEAAIAAGPRAFTATRMKNSRRGDATRQNRRVALRPGRFGKRSRAQGAPCDATDPTCPRRFDEPRDGCLLGRRRMRRPWRGSRQGRGVRRQHDSRSARPHADGRGGTVSPGQGKAAISGTGAARRRPSRNWTRVLTHAAARAPQPERRGTLRAGDRVEQFSPRRRRISHHLVSTPRASGTMGVVRPRSGHALAIAAMPSAGQPRAAFHLIEQPTDAL